MLRTSGQHCRNEMSFECALPRNPTGRGRGARRGILPHGPADRNAANLREDWCGPPNPNKDEAVVE